MGSERSASYTGSIVDTPVRSLTLVSLVLEILFAALVLSSLLPLQPWDPAWQLRLSNSLINSGPLALIGLVLLRLARLLDPQDPLPANRWRTWSQLAVVVALGFVLLAPLQLQAGLRLQKTLQGGQSARIVGAERRVAAIRAAVNKAASLDELNQSLQTLQGPKLGPAELAQPLPLVKQQILAALERVDQQVARARNAIDPNDRWKLLPDLLRNAIASLALATGFAALAKRPGAQFSLARELQASLLLRRRRPNRSSS